MSRPLLLEDFDRPAPARPGVAATGPGAVELEEERLKAFEKGYSAGWEDAARAHEEEQGRISSEFGRALQEMSFTFQEAQSALMEEVGGVLSGLVEAVLPAALRPALGAMIHERAMAAARQAGVTLEIVVAPDNVARVEALSEGRPAPPLRVVGEPALGAGQAFLRFGTTEEKIDLDAVLAELRDAVAQFARGDGLAGPDPRDDAVEDTKEMRHAG